jgi:putative heme-binding domain-containing protein
VLDILLGRDDWTNAAVHALEQKQVLSSEVDAARRQRLVDNKSAALRERAAKLFGDTINPDRQKVIDAYRSALTLKGDARQGLQVFSKVCAACHRLGDVGQAVGPDLAALSDKSPDYLLTNILDPNRAVEARYINYLAVTKSGLTKTGFLTSETSTGITLVGPDGKPQSILRIDLEELASTGKSAMPEGLEKDLKPQDFADLIAYLRGAIPSPKRKVFEGNQPEVVRPAADGSLRLLASNCEIYGSGLVLEKQYGNLGYWSNQDDHAVWSVEVPRAGTYAVWLDWACDDNSAGNTLVVQAGLNRLTYKVAGTGTWDTYRQAKIGEITLRAGTQQVVMRSVGKITGAMIDLKGVRLVPVAGR